ncbi:hypothetical protein ACQ4WN_25135, partial [Janthinobacterium sp. LB3P118]
ELGDEGFPLGWLHGRLPFVCYVPSDSRAPGKFSEFPYLSRTEPFIIATHLDGQAMALGGLGPLWAIHDADRIAAVAALPLAQRFASCPWALYHIGVEVG